MPDEAAAGLAAELLPSLLADRAAVAVVVIGLASPAGAVAGRFHHLMVLLLCPPGREAARRSALRCRAHSSVRRPCAAGRRLRPGGHFGTGKQRRDSPPGESATHPGVAPGRALSLTCLSSFRCRDGAAVGRPAVQRPDAAAGRAAGGAAGVSAACPRAQPRGTRGRPGLARAAGGRRPRGAWQGRDLGWGRGRRRGRPAEGSSDQLGELRVHPLLVRVDESAKAAAASLAVRLMPITLRGTCRSVSGSMTDTLFM